MRPKFLFESNKSRYFAYNIVDFTMAKKQIDYTEDSQQAECRSIASEATFVAYATDVATEDARRAFLYDFVYANYSHGEAQSLKERNFLMDEPFKYDDVETETDWEQLECEAEKSGVATSQEVNKVFGRWLNL